MHVLVQNKFKGAILVRAKSLMVACGSEVCLGEMLKVELQTELLRALSPFTPAFPPRNSATPPPGGLRLAPGDTLTDLWEEDLRAIPKLQPV